MDERSGDVISFDYYCWSLSSRSFRVTLDERDSQRLEEYFRNKQPVRRVVNHNTKCAEENSYTFRFLNLQDGNEFSGCVNKLPRSDLYEFYFRGWGNQKYEFSRFIKLINNANTAGSALLYLYAVTLNFTEKSVSFEAGFSAPPEDSRNQSECTGGSRSRSDSKVVSDSEVEAEEESYNPPSSEKTDPIQMKIEDLTAKITRPEGLGIEKFKKGIKEIEQAFSERRQHEAASIALQVDPIDLQLVKEILAKVTTPAIVKKTFNEDMLFKKIYELPSDRRLEFLKIRLLLNLLKLKSRKDPLAQELEQLIDEEEEEVRQSTRNNRPRWKRGILNRSEPDDDSFSFFL